MAKWLPKVWLEYVLRSFQSFQFLDPHPSLLATLCSSFFFLFVFFFPHFSLENPCESSAREKGTRRPLNHEDGHCADGSFGRSCHPKGTDY